MLLSHKKGKDHPVISVHGFINFTWNKNVFRLHPTPNYTTAQLHAKFSIIRQWVLPGPMVLLRAAAAVIV